MRCSESAEPFLDSLFAKTRVSLFASSEIEPGCAWADIVSGSQAGVSIMGDRDQIAEATAMVFKPMVFLG